MPKQQPRLTQIVEKGLTYANTTAVKLFTLPRGARVIRVMVFTDVTASGATCDVGVYGNTDSIVDGLDVSVAGLSEGTLLDITRTTTKKDIYGLIAGGSVGNFTIIFEYDTSRSRGPK